MIAVIGAMQIEIDAFAARMTNVRTEHNRLGIPVVRGTVGNHDVLAVTCGVGLVSAAAATAAIVTAYAPEAIVNVGVAGGLAGLKPFDVVIPSRIVQHDMDTSAVGEPLGYIGDLDCVVIETNETLRAELCAAADFPVRTGTLASGDLFVEKQADADRIRGTFGADCCDMEGAAIAHVAALAHIPCAVVRSISDAGDGADFAAFARTAADQAAGILAKWLENKTC